MDGKRSAIKDFIAQHPELQQNFAALSNGPVYYEVVGPVGAPQVVLIHGLSVPNFIWDPIVELLKEHGFRVLRFDLYGRGMSERPRVDYGLELYISQTRELLAYTKFDQHPIFLAGLSLGGGIAAHFTSLYPELVEKLVLFDPVGFPMHQKLFPAILKVPVINRLLFRWIAAKLLVDKIDKDFYDLAKFPRFKQLMARQFQFPGYFDAILSTLLNFPLEGLAASYSKVGGLGVPTQLFWGELDVTVPYRCHQELLKAIPQAEFHSIPQAAHICYIDRPDLVCPHFLDFLSKNAAHSPLV